MLNCEGWQDTSQLPHSWQDLKSGAGAAEDKTAKSFKAPLVTWGSPHKDSMHMLGKGNKCFGQSVIP